MVKAFVARFLVVASFYAAMFLIAGAQELEDIAKTAEQMDYQQQMYNQFPAPQQAGNAQFGVPQQPNRSFLGKVLGVMRKKASPPINMVPKEPKPQPRETQPLPDPLIRLGKGLKVNGATIPPGFYLLGLKPGANSSYLTINKQQQQLAQVPATAKSSPKPAIPDVKPVSLPEPPDKANPKKGKVEEVRATANVLLSEDGHSVILVYYHGAQQYTSQPIPLDETWRP